MASRAKLITADQSLITGLRNTVVAAISLCAAAATSTLEMFDGAIGTIATKAVGAAGTGYTELDVITVAQAGGGVQATMRVDTVDTGGEVLTFTILTGGSGYVAAATYATTGGTGTGFTVTASTVSDAGTSVAKLSAVANTAISQEICSLFTNGISFRITGSAAKGYLYYD